MDAISLLKDDHRTVEKLFKRFEKTGDRAHTERRRIVDEIIKELSVHAEIEETVFYPAVREAVPPTEDMVLESLEEHHVAKWVLSELDGMPPDSERFEAKVTVLMENIRHHVKEEESDLFPKVRKALSRKALEDMGEAMERAKAIAPTHPHPRSPDTPPGNIVTGVVAAALDRARDAGQELVEGAAGVVRRAANGTPSRPTKRTSRSSGGRKKKASTKQAPARRKASAKKSSAKRAAGSAKGTGRTAARKASRSAKKASGSAKRAGRTTAKKTSSSAKRAGRTTAKKASSTARKASGTAKRAGKTTARKASGTAKRAGKTTASKASGTARKAASGAKKASGTAKRTGRSTARKASGTAKKARSSTKRTTRPVKTTSVTTTRSTTRPAKTTKVTAVTATTRPRKVAQKRS
jgi:hemerythrin superfamily protein